MSRMIFATSPPLLSSFPSVRPRTIMFGRWPIFLHLSKRIGMVVTWFGCFPSWIELDKLAQFDFIADFLFF